MKRFLTIWTLGLLMQIPVSAQSYRVKNDSIFDVEMQGFMNASKPTYLLCIDSLIQYVRDSYGDNTKCASGSLYEQVTAPVSGSDERLRRVTSHIIKQLSRFPHLQQYSELKDEKNNLQGRYIVKFRPEGNDTSAYAFLKYDRNLILLRYSRNQALESPKKTVPTPSPVDEELSLWHQLKDRFEIICMGDIDVKYQFRSYREGPKHFFLTTPAPAVNSRTKMELIRVKDKDAFQFNFLCGYMELAGREEGTINGKLMNDNRFLINKDTCQYFYACHTSSNGLSEFIGVTHEDKITYLVRATSEKPGLCVNHWGKTNWMTPEEIKAITISDYQHLGVWVYDAETKQSINKAKLTTTDDEGNVLDLSEPYPDTPWADRLIYRYHCVVQRQSHYKIKIEADGYETAYAEITPSDDEESQQIEVYLKPKSIQKKKYIISGVIDNSNRPDVLKVKDGDIAFLWFDNPEKKIEVPVKDGKFRIEGYVEHPTECFFGVGGPAQYIILDNANYWVTLTFYKGKGTVGDHVLRNEMRIISDSELFNTYMSLYDLDGKLHFKLGEYQKKASACSSDSIDYYKKKIDLVKNEIDSVSLSTARNHPNKYLLPFVLLRQFDFSYERLWTEYERIPDAIKATPIGEKVRKELLKKKPL